MPRTHARTQIYAYHTHNNDPTNTKIKTTQGLHVRLDLSTGQRMGKLLDPSEAGGAAVGSGQGANATGGGEHVVILEGSVQGQEQERGGAGRKRLRVEGEEAAPVRTEGEVSGADARSPQETMEAVLLNLPAPERASMGIDAIHAVRACVPVCVWCGCGCRGALGRYARR
jgi:hypothetical protein